jgi:hypothetical protein
VIVCARATGSRALFWKPYGWKGPTRADIAQPEVAHAHTLPRVAMQLPVMPNDTFCTTSIVRTKRGNRLHVRTRSLPVMWPPITCKVVDGLEYTCSVILMKDTLQSQQLMESGGTCPLLSKVGVSSILAQFKSYFGGATGSDLTGNDIIGGQMTGSDRVRTCNRFPHFVLTNRWLYMCISMTDDFTCVFQRQTTLHMYFNDRWLYICISTTDYFTSVINSYMNLRICNSHLSLKYTCKSSVVEIHM